MCACVRGVIVGVITSLLVNPISLTSHFHLYQCLSASRWVCTCMCFTLLIKCHTRSAYCADIQIHKRCGDSKIGEGQKLHTGGFRGSLCLTIGDASALCVCRQCFCTADVYCSLLNLSIKWITFTCTSLLSLMESWYKKSKLNLGHAIQNVALHSKPLFILHVTEQCFVSKVQNPPKIKPRFYSKWTLTYFKAVKPHGCRELILSL